MNADHPLLVGAVSLAALVALAAPAATLPHAAAEPSSTTTTAPTPSTSAFRTDDYGYVGSKARCDATEVAVAFGRTARSLVAICVDRDGELEYRGVRLSDEASVAIPAGRTADGPIVATNDGVTYAVSPTMLLVSEGDTVLYRDAWVEFRQPRFSGNSPTSTAPTPTATTTTTVSTTTVTLPPNGASGR